MKSARAWIPALAVATALGLSGCPATEDPLNPNAGGPRNSSPATGDRPATDQGSSPETAAAQADVPAPVEPPPPSIPEVFLTAAQKTASLVAVGDTLPEGELPALEGDPQPVRYHYGDSLTVLFFWKPGQSATEQLREVAALEDLQNDVALAFADRGVQVVAVNVGGEPEAVKQQLDDAGAKFPVLLDRDGAYFAKVATDFLPRVYLLDATGKILWFDLQWSSTARQSLLQGIDAGLRESGDAAPPGEIEK
ncbi:MAG: TlpA family protein disulfide reductase [Thermoguttaceae bacterium]|nr:TlpA family protein disulfide reductase [Thermoguttaceae bacterium]